MTEMDVEQQLTHRHILILDRQKINLESHQLVWLGELVVPIENLRNIIDYIKVFIDIEDCLRHIEQTKESKTFLVCFLEYDHNILSRVHDLDNVVAIYFFYQKNTNMEWPSSSITYSKVKPIYANLGQLLDDLSNDSRLNRKYEERVKFERGEEDRSTDDENSSWACLMDFWLCLPYPHDSRERFIDTLKNYYQGDFAKLRILDEFEQNYNGRNAIQWYTRESFLYSSLNRALRQRQTELLFLYGFFLQDLHYQLDDEYKKQQICLDKLKTYRGQLISRTEIAELQDIGNLGDHAFIVNNSLFSTTLDRRYALVYRNLNAKPTDDIQNVLYEIEIDVDQKTRSFANISHLSEFENESEILFMIGTAFILSPGINYDEKENVWIIQLQLYTSPPYQTSEDDYKTSNKRVNLRRCLADIPRTMRLGFNITILDEIFYELFLMYPTEVDWMSAVRSHSLAVYQHHKSDEYILALSNYEHASQMWSNHANDEELNTYLQMGILHSETADFCRYPLEDTDKALKHYKVAIENFEKALFNVVNSQCEKLNIYYELSKCYNDRSQINDDDKKKNDLSMFIKYRELYIDNLINRNRDTIANNLQLIAETSTNVGDYDNAIDAFEKALRIWEDLQIENESDSYYYETSTHEIVQILANLIDLYENYKQNYVAVLQYQVSLHEHKTKLINESDADGVRLKQEMLIVHHVALCRIYCKLGDYSSARQNLIIVLNIYKEMPQSSVGNKILNIEEQIRSLETMTTQHEISSQK